MVARGRSLRPRRIGRPRHRADAHGRRARVGDRAGDRAGTFSDDRDRLGACRVGRSRDAR